MYIFDEEENLNYMKSLLPHRWNEEGHGENYRKILTILSRFYNNRINDDKDDLDATNIEMATGKQLDNLALNYAERRNTGELDEDFRERVKISVVSKKYPTSIPSIISIIRYVTGSNDIKVKENFLGEPSNIYLTGGNSSVEMVNVIKYVSNLLPAGVRITVSLLTTETWGSLKTDYASWQLLKDNQSIIW